MLKCLGACNKEGMLHLGEALARQAARSDRA
jgi:hypothetical protein